MSYVLFLYQTKPQNVLDSAQDKDVVFLIVGGYYPTVHTVTKHIVSLRDKTYHGRYGSNHICGGSIINNHTILTAAHCIVNMKENMVEVNKPENILVVAGTTHRLIQAPSASLKNVKEIIKHRKYDGSVHDDLALLKLEGTLEEDEQTIQSIKLVSEAPQKGQVCTIAGWGSLRQGGPMPDEIMYAEVTIIDFKRCRKMYKDDIRIRKGMLCTYDPGRDSCQGDSGGPLICNGRLAGITSFGLGCADPRYASVYMDVYYYLDWIARNGVGTFSEPKNFLVLLNIFFFKCFWTREM